MNVVRVERQKYTKKVLNTSSKLFQAILDGMMEGCQLIGFDWRYQYMNDAAVFQSRKTRGEMMGHSMMEVFPGFENGEVFQVLRESMEKRVPRHLEKESIYPDGVRGWFELSIEPVPAGILILSIDITDRKRSEDRVKTLAKLPDECPSPILRVGRDRVLLYANPASIPLINAWGCTIGNKIPPPREASGTRELDVNLPATFKTRAGNRTYEFNVVPFKDLGYVNLYGVDVTDREQAGDSLARSEAKYRALVEQLNDVIYTTDLGGHITYASPAIQGLTGKTPREVLNLLVFDFIHKEDRDAVARDYQQVLAGASIATEFRFINSSGNLRWIRVNTRPLLEGTKVVGTQGIITDITEKKLADQALRESEARLKEAQRLGRIGSWEYDIHARKMTWSDQTYQLYDRDPALGPPTVEEELALYSPAHVQLLNKCAKDALEGGKDAKFDVGTRLPSGRQVYLAGTMQPISDDHGRTLKLIGTVQDITERKRAEDALRTSEAQLSNALTIAHLGPWEYDVATDTFTFNDLFYRLFRTTTEREGGSKMSSARYARRFVHPDDGALVGIEVKNAIEASDPHFSRQLEHRIIYADGEIGYISVRFFIVKDEHGRTVRTYGVNQDITERKSAEEAVRESEQKFRSFIEQSTEGFILTDERGKVTVWNRSAQHIYGVGEAEVMGKDLWDLKFPIQPERGKNTERQAFLKNEILGALKDGKGDWMNRARDAEILRPTGEHAVIATSTFTVQSKKGFLLGIVSRDITAQKQAEDQLHKRLVCERMLAEVSAQALLLPDITSFQEKSLEILGKFLETSRVSFYKYRPDSKILVLLKEWRDPGCDSPEINPLHLSTPGSQWIAEPMERNEVKLYVEPVGDAVNGSAPNSPLSGERMMLVVPVHVEGDYFGFLGLEDVTRARAWKGEDIDILRTIATILAQAITHNKYKEHLEEIVRDRTRELQGAITDLERVMKERQKVEEELLEAKITAETANRAKSEFLANMSHELRTPLNAIIGFSQILQDGGVGPVDAEQQDALGNILESGNHLLTLINEILDIAKIEAGKVELTSSSFPLKPFLERCEALFREKVTTKNLTLTIEVTDGLETITADEVKLKQVLYNLLSNAVKFTLTGGEVGIRAKKVPGGTQVTVWDTGIGIAKEYIANLFQPFRRIETQLTKGISGTGLGLHFSKKLVELHGGKMWVESAEGMGSQFHFTIPNLIPPPSSESTNHPG